MKKYKHDLQAIQLDAAIRYVEASALRIKSSNSRIILFFVGIIATACLYYVARCLIKL